MKSGKDESGISTANLVRIEKNLASIGFFTPSTKRIRGEKKKVVTRARHDDGKRVEGSATILPSAEYGLPITADQDTYFAILKLAGDILQGRGRVENPITFTTAEILRIQGKSETSGYHYKELHEQLLRIKTATILSEGAVYFAGRKSWARDAFNVFDRVVLFGSQMENGSVADRHYIWFSEWQLENINNRHLLPIDYDTYRKLKNHIAKTLVPLLQIWMYASRRAGAFEKRYDEICQLLHIREYQHTSKIREKLGPSLDELQRHGYLAEWRVEPLANRSGFKIVLQHGSRFLTEAFKPITLSAPRAVDPVLIDALAARGVNREKAAKLLAICPPEQSVTDQIAWADYLLSQPSAKRFYNPAGFYVHLIQRNVLPPARFLVRHSPRAALPNDNRGGEVAASLHQNEYHDYQRRRVDRYLENPANTAQYEGLIKRTADEIRRQYKSAAYWTEANLREVAEGAARADLAAKIPMLDSESFRRKELSDPAIESLGDCAESQPIKYHS
ncbi:MAG: replication initiator protein A [Candidatus Acidiferrales bacterium]